MKKILLLSLFFWAGASATLFWQVHDEFTQELVCYLADFRMSRKQVASALFPMGLCDTDRFLMQVAQKGAPIVVVVPDQLEGMSPLDDGGLVLETARTALAWVRAYYQVLSRHCDVRIMTVAPGVKTSCAELALRGMSCPMPEVAYATIEDDLQARIISYADCGPSKEYKKYAVMPYCLPQEHEIMRIIMLPDALKHDTAKRYLVAGGAGFIGRHVVKALLEQGHIVIVIDNYASSSPHNLMEFSDNPRFHVVEHDIARPFIVAGPVDVVLHLASLPSPEFYCRKPLETLRVGLQGTKNLLDLARSKKSRFLFASTSQDFAQEGQRHDVMDIMDCLDNRSSYDQSKRGAEALIALCYEQSKIDVRIARIFNQMRSLDAVDDTVKGLCSLLHNQLLSREASLANRVFNIGGVEEYPRHLSVSKGIVRCTPRSNGSIFVQHVADVDAAVAQQESLDPDQKNQFAPIISLNDGYVRIYQFFTALQALVAQ